VVLVLALAVHSAAATGLVQPAGTVLLNGNLLQGRSAILGGDVVETQAQSTAVVTSKSVVANLSENSSLEMGPEGVQFRSGAIVITAESGATTDVPGGTVQADAGSRYVVRTRDRQTEIAVLKGGLHLVAGSERVMVPAGKGVSFAAFEAQDNDNQGNVPPRRRNVGWLNNDDLATLLLIGGGIAAGVGLGLYNALKDDDNENVSPSTP
jgi:hypothetical protein